MSPTIPTDRQLDVQVELLMQGCEYGDHHLGASMRARLTDRIVDATRERRALRVYTGYDPTAPDLHLGHAITLRAMRRFQELGHEVTVVVGTITATVGDTSDRATGRPRPPAGQVAAAAASYADQARTILDPIRTQVRANGDWLAQLTAPDLLEAASTFTVQQFLVRDNYRQRLHRGDPVGLHELLYVLLQGYDAVHLRADVQLGGTDQLFNILAGSRLQEAAGQPPSVALTYPILVGTDGTHRMSKSRGNYIGLTEAPSAQFGKAMSIPDPVMAQWAVLATGWSTEHAQRFVAALDAGSIHPMEAKKQLAHRIVEIYHGPEAAHDAQEQFEWTVQRGRLPDAIPETLLSGPTPLVEVLVEVGAAPSRSAARRLVQAGAVDLDQVTVTAANQVVDRTITLKVGPRRYFRAVIP